MKIRFVSLCVFIILLSCAVFSEMRMWREEGKDPFFGKFDKEMFGKIQLIGVNEEVRLIPFEKLSGPDREYIYKTIPPTVEIDVSYKRRQLPPREWTIDDDVTMLYTFTVRLHRVEKIPSQTKLSAELFVIGKEIFGGDYILMQRETFDFVIPEGRDQAREFVTQEIPFRQFPTWPTCETQFIRGQSYFGYLVVVSDSKGNILKINQSLSGARFMTRDIELTIAKLREIAVKGRGSTYSRHFNESFRKTRMPRVPWYERGGGGGF